MNLSKLKIVSVLLLAFLFTGCPKLEAPPVKVLPISKPQLPESTINLPFKAKISEINQLIWDKLKNEDIEEKGDLSFTNGKITEFKMGINGKELDVSTRVRGTATYDVWWLPTISCDIDATLHISVI